MDGSSHLRILIVDDSVLYRKIIASALNDLPDAEVVGVAANGRLALQQIELLRPDLVTLDLEMPEMDGLQVLERLSEMASPPGTIMLSALTSHGAETTVRALHLGAFEFVLKPIGSDVAANVEKLKSSLLARVEAFRASRGGLRAGRPAPRPIRREGAGAAAPARPATPPAPSAPTRPPEVVLIGVSTGGPAALNQVVPKLPDGFPLPVLIVQHMPPLFTQSLARDLCDRSRLRVEEARHGQIVTPGTVLIAPGGRQMKVVRTADHVQVVLTDDPPENSCRPAVDYLFRSAVEAYCGACLGVILTGMGSDGTEGARCIKQGGGTVLAQDAHTCVVYGMPRSVVEHGLADGVFPLDQIEAEIARRAGAKEALCI
ncbi:MAG: chemotaxis response regulator protein-glutamate methylesterase [Phycisphaerales bacterium]|nr:chemotaxis response regulator protein-glutamate methylesterase [Phycisphaerales bacterium]